MTNAIEQLRLQLLANGYSPIPNRDKRTFTKGWPTVEITPEQIHTWSRNRRDDATGLRIENGLCAIDIDVNLDQETADLIAQTIDRIVPGLSQSALIRFGKGFKEAWFCRAAEIFSRIHTRSWVRPGETVDESGGHRVEIFGGASSRQFGAFGAHTKDDGGTVLISYEWDGPSPADVPLDELPVIDKADMFKIADAVDKLLEARGWSVVPRSQKGESDAHRVYDLAEDMEFELNDGRVVSLAELRDIAATEEGVRCSASWVPEENAPKRYPTGWRTDRCLITQTRRGQLAIYETAAGTTHLEASLKPKDYRLDLDRLAEQLRALETKKKFTPKPGDDAVTVAAKLIETYAWCARSKTPVVPIWATSIDAGITMTNFRTMMLPFAEEEIGPRGGRNIINPVDIWAGSERRATVQGLQMRPDQPRPLYEDASGTWINIYAPPEELQGGDAQGGIDLINHLLPEERERAWFLQWLAFKRQRPDIPGPAVVMVARQFGTGRGTLFDLIGRLFGPRYVKTVPYHLFAGTSYQSQYNDWGAEALFACVSESTEAEAGASVYKAKRSLYEHLKEIVEPKPTMRFFVRKGDRSFEAPSFTTYLIATNHSDALAIPADDRRLAVLTNGDKATPEFWVRINAWMDRPENICAFGRWLDEEVDLEGYSPFAAPIDTDAKADMASMAQSDIDLGFELVLSSLVSGTFVPAQIINLMRKAQAMYDYDYPDGWQKIVKRMIQRACFRVGVPHGLNWTPQIENKRHPVYATTRREANQWKVEGTSDDLRMAILRNGSTDPSVVSTVSLMLRGRVSGVSEGTQAEKEDTTRK